MRRRILWWSVFAALVVLQIFWSVARTYDTYDQSWFLLVAKRILAGETLYRDVYFNTTPLSMYVTAAAVAVTGVQLLTVELVVAFSVLASIMLGWKIIERAVPSERRVPLLLIALVIVYGNYQAKTPYTPLAVTLFMLTLLGFLVWHDERRNSTLFWSGIAAGFSFASKYNIGLLAVAALALGVFIVARARLAPRIAIARALASIVAGFSLVVAAMVAVIAATGAFPAFVEYAFSNKTMYVAVGWTGFIRALGLFIDALRAPFSIQSVTTIYIFFVCAVPVVAIALMTRWFIAADREQKARVVALSIFLIAAAAGSYPQAASSMPFVVPALGAIAGIAWRLGAAPRSRALRISCVAVVALWLSIGAARMLMNPINRLMSPEWRFSQIAHCRGIIVETDDDEMLLRQARELRAAVPSREAFIQTLNAGFYYLASGIRNPTPYDLPAVTTFGPRGQQKVIASIISGRIEHVAVIPSAATYEQPWQSPQELMRYVETSMTSRVQTDTFIVYSRDTRTAIRPPQQTR
jgi:hypothetical protein